MEVEVKKVVKAPTYSWRTLPQAPNRDSGELLPFAVWLVPLFARLSRNVHRVLLRNEVHLMQHLRIQVLEIDRDLISFSILLVFLFFFFFFLIKCFLNSTLSLIL